MAPACASSFLQPARPSLYPGHEWRWRQIRRLRQIHFLSHVLYGRPFREFEARDCQLQVSFQKRRRRRTPEARTPEAAVRSTAAGRKLFSMEAFLEVLEVLGVFGVLPERPGGPLNPSTIGWRSVFEGWGEPAYQENRHNKKVALALEAILARGSSESRRTARAAAGGSPPGPVSHNFCVLKPRLRAMCTALALSRPTAAPTVALALQAVQRHHWHWHCRSHCHLALLV